MTDLLAESKPGLKGWTCGPISPGGQLSADSNWVFEFTTGLLACEGNGGHDWLRRCQPAT